MRRAAAPVAVLASIALLAAACGSTSPVAVRTSSPSAGAPSPGETPFASASPSIEASPPPSPSPSAPPPPPAGNLGFLLPKGSPESSSVPILSSMKCSGAIGPSDPVAIGELSSGEDVLRDYADVAHPRTECQLGINTYDVWVISAQHLLVAGQFPLYVVVDLPGKSLHWFQLPNLPNQFATLIAVSPHLDSVTYLTQDDANNADKVHVASRAGDKVVASLYNPHYGRCGSAEDSMTGAYSPSASYSFVLDQPVPNLNSLLVVGGTATKLLLPVPENSSVQGGYGWPNATQPAMAVWSSASDTLYYRQGGNVMRWSEASGAVTFLSGVTWYYPTVSADGRYLAYAVYRSDKTTHNVYLVDLNAASPAPKLIGQLWTTPVFLNSSQLWYRSEAQGVCGPGGYKPLVYDVKTGTSAASLLTNVWSVWPSTSSNY